VIKRLLASASLAVAYILLVASPVLAIANPTTIAFGSAEPRYKVFVNVQETGDMLFVAESYIYYAEPPAYPGEAASDAFTFQVLNVAGDTVLLQTPVADYADTVISIYQTKAQVDAAGYSASNYKLRLSGNVALFGDLTENTNMKTVTINTGSDFVDQSVAEGIESPLYAFCIAVIDNIEADSGETHTIEIDGVTYLDTSGANLFLAGIPSLNVFLPEIFQATASPMTAEDPEHTGQLQLDTTPTTMLGGNIGRSVANMSDFMGTGTTTAGIIISAFLGFLLLPVIYTVTKNGTLTMGTSGLFMIFCGYIGLFPLAIGFIIASIILILTGFLFWGRLSV